MTATRSPSDDARLVASVFARLKAIFGVQRFGAHMAGADVDVVHAEWRLALKPFDAATVHEALTRLAAKEARFVPSTGEFVALCSAVRNTPGRNPPKRVEHTRTAAELDAGRERLRQLREQMGLAARQRREEARRARPDREPGDDDEPVAPPACTCWTGAVRAPQPCPYCARYAALREVRAAVAEARR